MATGTPARNEKMVAAAEIEAAGWRSDPESAEAAGTTCRLHPIGAKTTFK